jgi:hypothetical protein
MFGSCATLPTFHFILCHKACTDAKLQLLTMLLLELLLRTCKWFDVMCGVLALLFSLQNLVAEACSKPFMETWF